LAGVRIVEISSFVAVPLAGMTLAALGADVVRVDPIGGAADYHRWPLTDDGESIYWAGLNKGKRSMAVDTRGPQGQQQVQRLIAEAGVLITNVTGRQWHSPSLLGAMRPDLIHLEVVGRGDGVAWVPEAAIWPYELRIAPLGDVPDLPDDRCDRDGLAAVLVDVLARLDQRFDEPMPYMLWIHQRPTDGGEWPGARVCVTIAPLLRAPGTQRYVAAAELGGGVYFNPVDPVQAAAALRALPGAPV
jgi:hypothetical protein